MARARQPKKVVLPVGLLLVLSGCTAPNNPGLQIVSAPIIQAGPNAAAEFTFRVSVRNTSAQATQANEVYIRNEAKDFTAGPVCQGGASNAGQETINIPALQPNQTWLAADKRIMDIPTFQSIVMTCSCKVNQCSGTMRFSLFRVNNQPYLNAQSIIELQWDKSGDFTKNVVTDKSLIH